jgi:choline dehydrogenase-like flavoprotein
MARYRSEDDLAWLRDLIKTERDVLLGTGHPQGGNRISKNRGRDGIDGGVIDPDFKVYGYDNLYVCDASVFPTATTVNPQLTVMTLAHYAADRIGAR